MAVVNAQSVARDLNKQLDFFKQLQKRMQDTGEAYPGERSTLQTHINCVARVLELDGQPSANDER